MPQYNNYSDLLSLALGFNIIYIVINKSKSDRFFVFLDWINFKEGILFIKVKRKYKETYITKLDYLKTALYGDIAGKLDKVHLSHDTIPNVKNRNKSLTNLESLHDRIKRRFYQTENLNLIAFITTLYAFYILLYTPYLIDDVKNETFNKSLVLTNIVIVIMSIFYLVSDFFEKRELRKSICLISFIMLVGIIVLTRSTEININYGKWITDNNYWITVICCYIAFLTYIFSSGISGAVTIVFIVLGMRTDNKINKLVEKLIDAGINEEYIDNLTNETKSKIKVELISG